MNKKTETYTKREVDGLMLIQLGMTLALSSTILLLTQNRDFGICLFTLSTTSFILGITRLGIMKK